ncbi:BTB/POZ domain protein, partial [Opisthorchis viverrini]
DAMANSPQTDAAIGEHKDTDSTAIGRESSDGTPIPLPSTRTGQFCDVTLKAGSTTVFAHRAVLASSSHYFNAMFSHPVRESYSECVTLQDVDEAALVRIVEFIYTG